MSFKEWYLIPSHVYDTLSDKANHEEQKEKQEEEEDVKNIEAVKPESEEKTNQEGGNLLTEVLEKKHVKGQTFELSKQLEKEKKKFVSPKIVKNENLLLWFDSAAQYKVHYLLKYIEKNFKNQVTWDKEHNIIIKDEIINVSDIVEIIRYLFGLGRYFSTQLTPLAIYQGEEYGIPKGTIEFINLLTENGEKDILNIFEFDPIRLTVLFQYFFPSSPTLVNEETNVKFDDNDLENPVAGAEVETETPMPSTSSSTSSPMRKRKRKAVKKKPSPSTSVSKTKSDNIIKRTTLQQLQKVKFPVAPDGKRRETPQQTTELAQK